MKGPAVVVTFLLLLTRYTSIPEGEGEGRGEDERERETGRERDGKTERAREGRERTRAEGGERRGDRDEESKGGGERQTHKETERRREQMGVYKVISQNNYILFVSLGQHFCPDVSQQCPWTINSS